MAGTLSRAGAARSPFRRARPGSGRARGARRTGAGRRRSARRTGSGRAAGLDVQRSGLRSEPDDRAFSVAAGDRLAGHRHQAHDEPGRHARHQRGLERGTAAGPALLRAPDNQRVRGQAGGPVPPAQRPYRRLDSDSRGGRLHCDGEHSARVRRHHARRLSPAVRAAHDRLGPGARRHAPLRQHGPHHGRRRGRPERGDGSAHRHRSRVEPRGGGRSAVSRLPRQARPHEREPRVLPAYAEGATHLPLVEVGEVIVVAVRPEDATVRVLLAKDAIVTGDLIAEIR